MKKRKDGRYRTSFTKDGVTKYFYGKTMKEAKRLRDEYKKSLERPWSEKKLSADKMVVTQMMDNETDMLFRDYFDDYLQSIQNISRSFSSKMDVAPHIMEGLGYLKMSEISKNVLRRFLNDFAGKKYRRGKNGPWEYYSQSMINKVYDLLHDVIREAASEDGDQLLRMDFMASLDKPASHQHTSEKEQVFTDAEIKEILLAVESEPMIEVWIYLMANLGVRPSEALALKFSDIDYVKGTVKIQRTLGKITEYDIKTKKRIGPSTPIIKNLKNETASNRRNYQRRELRVSKATLAILKKWEITVKNDETLMALKQECGTAEYLFCGSKGQFWKYDEYKQLYERTLQKKGIDWKGKNPYMFRHTVCTNLLRSGVDVKTTQLILGDNTPDMVLRVYANMTKEDILNGCQIQSNRIDEILEAEII